MTPEDNGYTFCIRTDTEVLIYLYREYGRDFIHRLLGMFALGIWDKANQELFLARDRIGIKLLYYTSFNGQFVFASEIKAIPEHPDVKREVDEDVSYHYLSFLTTPASTILFKKHTFQVYEDILDRVITPWEAEQRKYAEFALPYQSSQRNVGMNEERLKGQIKEYWNREICGTGLASSEKYSRQYFDEIEDSRYSIEPEVFSFAQFTRFRGQKVLEVGIGAGTDFIQWVRAGAKAYGIDLAEESVEHVRNRLRIYGLSAEEVRVADAENLPYPDNAFDLVYSWGVIHHTPDTIKALKEIIRVTRIGGIIKIMVYNRRSLNAFRTYLRFGLLKGRPFKSISWVLYRNMESIGTRAFTIREIEDILADYPVHIRNIRAKVTNYDLLWNRSPLLRFISYVLAYSLGFQKTGWFMTIELQKTGRLEMSKYSNSH